MKLLAVMSEKCSAKQRHLENGLIEGLFSQDYYFSSRKSNVLQPLGKKHCFVFSTK